MNKIPDKAFQVDESGKIPEGARVMDDIQAYWYQERKINNYEPSNEMLPIKKANRLIVCSTIITSCAMAGIFRKSFKTVDPGHYRVLFMPVGSICCIAGLLHSDQRNKIILGNNSTKIKIKSGLLNGLTNGPCAAVLCTAACTGVKRQSEGGTIIQILKSVNSSHLLTVTLTITAIQFCVGVLLADLEIKCIEKATIFYHDKLMKESDI